MNDINDLLSFLEQEFAVEFGGLIRYNGRASCVEFPANVSSIRSAAFYWDDEISEIRINDKITDIDKGAVSYCNNLSIITVDKNNKVYDSRNNCNAIIETQNNLLLLGCKGTIIPDDVEKIGEMAFENCEDLTSITIPCSIRSIAKDAFRGCSCLSSITVDVNNNTYDSRNDCNAIIETRNNTLIRGCNNTVIPDGVISIGDYAFDGCEYLTNINIPNSLTTIGFAAFLGCTVLSQITIPDSVISIGAKAFALCSNIVIKCAEGSCAHKYALECNIPFELI